MGHVDDHERMSDDALLAHLPASGNATLATLKRDGRPQLSVITYTYADGVIRFSTTADRAKVPNLRRDSRASLLVDSPGGARGYLVVEGTAQVGEVATTPDDDAVAELIDVYRAVAGEHPDWDDYRRAMVADRRLVVRVPVERVYGWVL